jgi:hypothetical protein
MKFNIKKIGKSLRNWVCSKIGCESCGHCQWDSESEMGYTISQWQECEEWTYGFNSDDKLNNFMSDKVMDDPGFPFLIIPIECLIHKKFITMKKWKEEDNKYWEEMGKQIDAEIAKEQANEMVR